MVKKSSWPSQICSHVASSTFALIGCVFRFLSNQIGIKSKWRKKGSQSVSTFFSGSQLANSKLMALMVTRNECIKFECPPHEHTFHILMLQNPSFDVVVPEVHKIRWSRDCEAQKWWKGRSGSTHIPFHNFGASKSVARRSQTMLNIHRSSDLEALKLWKGS